MSESNTPSPTPLSPVDLNVESVGNLTQDSVSDQVSSQVDEIKQKVVAVLSELPGYVSNFFGEYQKPIVTVILIVTLFVALKLLFAMVDALNDIPLLAPMFELIGIGFAAWFVYRYLLRASNRQELAKEFQVYKDQVLGQ
ncbi:MAG: CAAD domain-containing protein [Microcoleaceae cyanobacterium]